MILRPANDHGEDSVAKASLVPVKARDLWTLVEDCSFVSQT